MHVPTLVPFWSLTIEPNLWAPTLRPNVSFSGHLGAPMSMARSAPPPGRSNRIHHAGSLLQHRLQRRERLLPQGELMVAT